jgi:hypothetical protein
LKFIITGWVWVGGAVATSHDHPGNPGHWCSNPHSKIFTAAFKPLEWELIRGELIEAYKWQELNMRQIIKKLENSK